MTLSIKLSINLDKSWDLKGVFWRRMGFIISFIGVSLGLAGLTGALVWRFFG